MDTTTTSTDAQAPEAIKALVPDDLSVDHYARMRGWKRAPKPRPHEDLEAVLEESFGQPITVLLNSRVGLGKTEGVLRTFAKHQTRAAVLIESHKLADEWLARALALGINAAKPLSLEEGCVEQDRVREVLDAGHQRSVACFGCPSRVGCPYIASHRAARSATVMIATKSMARDEGAIRRLAEDREALVNEEDAMNFLAPAHTLDPRDIAEARAWLVRAPQNLFTKAGERTREAVLRFLTALETTHAVVAHKSMLPEEMQEEHSLARDIPLSKEDRALILGMGWRAILRAARREVLAVIEANKTRRAGTPARKLPKNLMPTLRVFAKEAGTSQMLWATGAQSWRVTSRPRLPKNIPVWILDATADPDLTHHLLRSRGRRLRVVGGGETLPGNVIRVTGQKVFSRASLREKDCLEFSQDRVEAAAEMIATTFQRIGSVRPGLVTFKGLLDAGQDSPLVRLVCERAGIESLPVLWYGNLRSQDSLRDRDALIVYGTPTPHQDEIRRVALLLGASWRDLYETPRQTHYDEAGEIVPVFAYRPGPMLLAWHLLVRSEVLQAAGRAMRGNQSATIFIFASCIIGCGVKQKSLTDLGLTGIAHRVVTRGLELYEEELNYAGGSRLGAELSLDDRHRAIRVGVAALPFWTNERFIVQHGGRTGCPATVTAADSGVILPSEVLMSSSLRDTDTGSPRRVPVLITSLKGQDSEAPALMDKDLGLIPGPENDLTVDPTVVLVDRIRQFPMDLQALFVPYLTDREVDQMMKVTHPTPKPQDIDATVEDLLLLMAD